MATELTAGIGVGADPPRRPTLVHALVKAEQDVLEELEDVRRWLAGALKATVESDHGLAAQVAGATEGLGRSYEDVHDELMAVIALQAPVAGDLRLAMALVHVNDRIARMGAQCANIATLCQVMPADARPSPGQLECLSSMAQLADHQVAGAARAFRERDPGGVARLRERDLQINDENRRCFELAVHEGTSEERRRAAFFVALMARALERIGDNAVDIARQAAFVVTGRLHPDR